MLGTVIGLFRELDIGAVDLLGNLRDVVSTNGTCGRILLNLLEGYIVGLHIACGCLGLTNDDSAAFNESYADGNLAVTAYLSDPTDESFGQPWSSVTVNFGSPLQQNATVFLDTNNMGEAMLSKISQLGAFTGQFMRSGFCSYPAFTFDTEVMGNMRDLNEFASADHSSLAELRGACHAALENVYGSEFTDALESGYDLNAESHDCASGSAVLETCDTTRAEQPTNRLYSGLQARRP